MKKINLILSSICIMAMLTVNVCAETATKTSGKQVDMTDGMWSKAVTDATADLENWTFTSGNSQSPGWAEYTDFNAPFSVESTSKGVHSSITSLPQNPRGRVGIYHKSIQDNTGGRVLQFTGGGYKNFAVTFDIQAVNAWNAASNRKAYFDFGLIEDSLPVKELQTGYEGQKYIRLGSSIDMVALKLPSGAAGGEISTRAAVINTKGAAEYPNAVVKTDALTGADYIESVTENGTVTYWNQVINCKVVVDGDVMSIYMKFEDADDWKHIESFYVTSLKDINKRFYVVCSGFQMLVSNFDIYTAKDPDVTVAGETIGARKGSEISLNFTSDIDETTVNADNIKLTTADGTPVAAVLSAASEPYSYVLTVGDWLAYDSEYLLQFTDISNTFGRKMNKQIKVKTDKFTTKLDFGNITFASGVAKVPVLANIEGDITSDIIVMVCDGTESLYCVKNLKYINSTVNTEGEETIEISVPAGMQSPFIKVMAVDNMNNIKMYAKPAVLNLAQ